MEYVRTFFSKHGIILTEDQAERIHKIRLDLLSIHPESNPLDTILRLFTPMQPDKDSDWKKYTRGANNELLDSSVVG